MNPTLFDPVRTTDPDTSRAAAQSIAGTPTAQMKARVLAALRLYGPQTAAEIGAVIDMPGHCVSSRLNQLRLDALAAPTDYTRPGPTGRSQTVWEVWA